jgi:hypothetical protein
LPDPSGPKRHIKGIYGQSAYYNSHALVKITLQSSFLANLKEYLERILET